MALDINNMGSIVKGFTNKHGGGAVLLAPYKAALIIFIVIIIVAAGYFTVVYQPLKEKNLKKKEELAKIVEMQKQLPVLDKQLADLKLKLDKSKEQYLESLSHFGNSEDLGGLYQTVSTLATKYGLVVLNVKEIPAVVEKVKAKPLDGKAAKGDAKKEGDKKEGVKKDADKKDAAKKDAAPAAPKKPAIEVKEIKVEVELKGHYGEYIKFKEDLSLAEILLKINTESIMVKDEKVDKGSIYVKLNLSTYAIDKKPFKGIVAEDEKTADAAAEDSQETNDKMPLDKAVAEQTPSNKSDKVNTITDVKTNENIH